MDIKKSILEGLGDLKKSDDEVVISKGGSDKHENSDDNGKMSAETFRKNIGVGPAEVEPILGYVFFSGEAEMVLSITGYFKGEAIAPRLYYDGGNSALFVRGPHQVLMLVDMLEDVDEEFRTGLMNGEKVVVVESQIRREHELDVIKADIEDYCREVSELHDYVFLYHLNPLSDGTFNVGSKKCEICDQETMIYYKGKDRGGKVRTVCAECIYGGCASYSDVYLYPEVDERCKKLPEWEEVFDETPPFIVRGETVGFWGVHCGTFGMYLGRLEPEDLTEDLAEELIETWDNEFNRFKDKDPEAVLDAFRKGKDLEVHIFLCMECRKAFCLVF